MTTSIADPATVWEQNGAPVRLVFRGERWRVVDIPTPLTREPDVIPDGLTHPPTRHIGWRLRARSESGTAITVDLVRSGDGWTVGPIQP